MSEQEKQHDALSRRRFIGTASAATAVGVAAPYFASPTALGQEGTTPPSDRIQVGLIGCGGMGRGNLRNCAVHKDVVVTAACDVWGHRRDAVVNQHKESCKPYSDFRETIAAEDVDAVVIGTPPHWHTLPAIAAAEAKKDFYLQKPMTLHLGESLAIKNAVKKHGVITQIGTQIHATENYRRVVELIRSGNLGHVSVARTFNVMNQGPGGVGKQKPGTKPPSDLDWDRWCGPAPLIDYNAILAANSFNHCSWMDYAGGWTPGMAPHIIDLPVWALDLGYPTVTSCSGGRYVIDDDGDAYDTQEILWQYPKHTMTWMSTLANSYGFDLGSGTPSRRLGMYFHGVNGTMYCNYGMHKIVAEGKNMDGLETPEPSIESSPGHEREWLNSIRSREQASCSVFYHTHVDVPLVLGNLSYRLGRSIQFDAATEKIIGDDAAAKMAVPEYRAPWKFPAEYLEG